MSGWVVNLLYNGLSSWSSTVVVLITAVNKTLVSRPNEQSVLMNDTQDNSSAPVFWPHLAPTLWKFCTLSNSISRIPAIVFTLVQNSYCQLIWVVKSVVFDSLQRLMQQYARHFFMGIDRRHKLVPAAIRCRNLRRSSPNTYGVVNLRHRPHSK